MATIAENYLLVQERIAAACARSGRSSDSVTLVVVTKTQPVEKLIQVLTAGGKDLGENYPEETDAKIQGLNWTDPIKWHMIGHIQSRKIKYIVKYFGYVHSIDRMEIAEKLSTACMSASIRLPVLLEINIAGEESKFGFVADNSGSNAHLIDQISGLVTLPGIELRGIMCMPPLAEKPGINRQYFIRCRDLLFDLSQQLNLPGFNQLSMGTSTDFEVAIEEGSNFVRIGEAIMGLRNYP